MLIAQLEGTRVYHLWFRALGWRGVEKRVKMVEKKNMIIMRTGQSSSGYLLCWLKYGWSEDSILPFLNRNVCSDAVLLPPRQQSMPAAEPLPIFPTAHLPSPHFLPGVLPLLNSPSLPLWRLKSMGRQHCSAMLAKGPATACQFCCCSRATGMVEQSLALVSTTSHARICLQQRWQAGTRQRSWPPDLAAAGACKTVTS